jgi:hypothetical protein
MGAYIEVEERFWSGDDAIQRRFEQVTGYSSAPELAYREVAELKDKIGMLRLERRWPMSSFFRAPRAWTKRLR